MTVGATTYQGVVGANGAEITLRIAPYGGAPFKWDRLAPATLLAMSNAFIRPGAPDAAERQWLAAVYAQSTGQTEAAKTLAEAAAKAKPEYERELRFLLAPEVPAP